MPYVHAIRFRWLLLVAAALVATLAVVTLAASRADAQPAPEVHSQHFPTIPLWAHHVEIKIPFHDADGDGRNDYDPQFNLRSVRTGGPTSGEGDWCPPELTRSLRVGNSGSEVLATYTASLLHQECQFQTEFPETIESGVAGFTLSRASGSRAQVTNRHSDTARVTYTDGRTTFHPDLSVSGFGPEDEGTVITLRFSRETGVRGHGQCRIHDDDRIERWRIDDRGRAIRERRATLIATLPAPAPDYGRDCRYAARWPSIEGFTTPARDVLLLVSGSGHVTGRYQRIEVIEATSFKPALQLIVPFTDYDADGAHDYRDARLRLTFNRQSGQPAGCSNGVTADYTVGAREHPAETITTPSGEVMLRARATLKPAETVTLVDTPRNSQHNCQYDVVFGANDEVDAGNQPRLVMLAGASIEDTELSAADPFAFGAYENAAISRTVTFAVTVPPAASAEGFGVAFTPVADQEGCSDGGALLLMPDSDGQASAEVTLIDYWQGHSDATARCEYTATWASSGDATASIYQRMGAAEEAIGASVFDATDRTISRSYGEVAQTFTAVIEVLTATPADADATFTVSITTDTNADPGCSQIPDQQVVVLAGRSSGQTVVNDVVERAIGASVDCAYTVEWPTGTTGVTAWERDTTHATATSLTASGSIVNARYYPVFNGILVLSTTVPVTADTTFTVPIEPSASSPPGCSDPDDLTLTVTAGNTSATGFLDRLISLPPGETTGCTYEVAWPENEDLAAAPPGGDAPMALWAADQTHGTTSEMGFDARRVTHRYLADEDTHFEADIAVHVPQIEGPIAGVNLFAGTEFTLTFARAPHSHAGCSTGTPDSFIYTVQPDGSVTGDHPTPLVDVPAGGSESCVYLFTASGASAPPEAPISWSLHIETVSATFQASARRPLVEYLVGDIIFAPQVAIVVPQIDETIDGAATNVFADAVLADGTTAPLSFDVAFANAASPDAGCTDTGSTTHTYEVQPDGTVTGDAPALAAYAVTTNVMAHPAEQTAVPCTYDVTFPTTSSGRAWLTKSTDASDDDDASATDPSAMATYTSTEIVTPIDVAVTTPSFTPPPGRAVSLTISAAQDADNACLVDDLSGPAATTATKTVTLDASGATRVVNHFNVTDFPADATSADDRCSYDVAWSATDEPVADAIWTRTTSDAALATAGRVGATATASAAYVVPVETSFDATLSLVVVDHVPENTAFAVTIAPASGAPAGCSTPPELTFTAPAADGTNDRTISQTVSLLHTVAGVVGHCSYEITWPMTETGDSLFAPDEAFSADTMLSQQSPSATNRYSDNDAETTFAVTLTVSTTEDADTAITFTVAVARAPGASTACSTPSPDPQITIEANTSTATLELSLVRRPASETAECSYTLTWPMSEDTTSFWAQDPAFTPDPTLSASSLDAANRYAPDITFFAPALAFDVAAADFDSDGSHDYAGAHFLVTFSSTDEDCSSATRAYELGANGGVEPVTPFQLVDEHPSAACTYTVAFAPRSDETNAGVLRKVADATDDETVTAADPAAAATYRESVTRFDAHLYLGGTHTLAEEDAVNPIPAGTPFTVTVRPQANAPGGCDADPTSDDRSATVTIAKAVVVERRPHTQLTRTLIAGLVADTATGEHCVYDVVWPANEDDGTLFIIDADPARPFSNTVRAGTADDTGAVVWYRADPSLVQMSFAPTVSVEVPQLEGTTAGQNIWIDRQFVVTIDRASGADGECSLDAPVSVTFTVQADGSVTNDGRVPSSLIGTLAGGATQCEYTVTFPAAPTDDDDDFDWMLSPTAATEVTLSDTSASTMSATGTYTVGVVEFVPDAQITVPTGNDGKQFVVGFASSDVGCSGNPTAVELTYAVADANAATATANASNPKLVAYVDGSATVCSYTATFGSSEETTSELALEAGADTTLTGTDQAVAATYAAAVTAPQPPVVTPPTTGGTSGGRSPSGGGGRGGGRSTPAATGPWMAASSRVPASVTLTMPDAEFPVGAVVEVMLSAPGNCGDDLVAFDGLAAQVGLVFALHASANAQVDVLAGAALAFAAYQERGDQTRDCDLRVTLITAPVGCTLDAASVDDQGRTYVTLDGGEDLDRFTTTQALACGEQQSASGG